MKRNEYEITQWGINKGARQIIWWGGEHRGWCLNCKPHDGRCLNCESHEDLRWINCFAVVIGSCMLNIYGRIIGDEDE